MYKVIVPFRDKTTKKRYEKGDTFQSDDAERIAFLISKGRLEQPVTEEAAEQKQTENKDQKETKTKGKKGSK
ncbi:hypothetical protein M3616_11245 [Bacillus velezensis]|uniref:hypothetical protein n=1 Tax=Bacillus amyloliquefaciens group TaxID=1938374 RepID=UPI0006A8B99C|nr:MULTISPECIES: hypothetical protein [Bacillus amyloliquefaciens group]MCA1231438.1 hypothetical protein [Bacillus velezensis]MCA1309538.1 hypothetical protein [Bacillus velezensis]MCA1329169.1 hypothetical protein [Bacillus velezensis]MCM3276655.1 hypothetical protein [Bacillus velezensis]MCM3349797.1 hypothetical protein [Bacillus velezensis]